MSALATGLSVAPPFMPGLQQCVADVNQLHEGSVGQTLSCVDVKPEACQPQRLLAWVLRDGN